MTTGSGWLDVSRQLNQLQGCAAAAHRAALDSIGSGNADAFIQSLAELGQSLSQAQSALCARPDATPMPAELVLQMEQLRTSLDNLWSLNSRLSVQAQRALGVLFPVDQVNIYSRLGGRGMGPAGAGRGYLKA